MTLTAPQLRVLRLMRDGFRIRSIVCGRSFQPQPDRTFKTILPQTLAALQARGLVEVESNKYPVTKWKLTALGREAAGEGA